MITKFNLYNESLRDQMKPKSDEEVGKGYENVFTQEALKLSEIYLTGNEYKEIAKLMKKPFRKLYRMTEEESYHYDIW